MHERSTFRFTEIDRRDFPVESMKQLGSKERCEILRKIFKKAERLKPLGEKVGRRKRAIRIEVDIIRLSIAEGPINIFILQKSF